MYFQTYVIFKLDWKSNLKTDFWFLGWTTFLGWNFSKIWVFKHFRSKNWVILIELFLIKRNEVLDRKTWSFTFHFLCGISFLLLILSDRLLLLMEYVRVRGMLLYGLRCTVLYVITRDAILLSVSPKPTNWKRVEI